ncbi:esterase-like activity of phytase family protein [Palleronia sp. KMU-117]|uniref:esterase-like activity of phytase family protein n=1 Tax=Palleronia sp. KMU-117 TaxID=3434108 RepID=UPI003D707DDD
MRASPVALIALLALPAAADELSFVGATEWGFEAVNGVSGLEFSDDGSRFWAVTDRGWYLTGAVTRTGDGTLDKVTVTRIAPLLGQDGFPVTARRVGDWSDAEGLAMLPDGTAFVAFERWAHVSRYDDLRGRANPTRDHPTFHDYFDNRQLEAIAVAPDGTVYAFPESVGPGRDGFLVYRLNGNEWDIAGKITPLDAFALVGADYDDQGRLYLLERKLTLGLWWQNRIRRFETPDGMGEILWTSRPGEFTNLEGIALWRDDQGLRITMVSDNNQRPSEPTTFVEFRLTAEPAQE